MSNAIAILCAIVAAVVIACLHLEVGIIFMVGILAWVFVCGDDDATTTTSTRPSIRNSGRATNVVQARRATREEKEEAKPVRSQAYPVVRTATVNRIKLASELPSPPSEHFLDDTLNRAIQRRNHHKGDGAAHGRDYHTRALPAAIAAAAQELVVTRDPSIVPLDATNAMACKRSLGHV